MDIKLILPAGEIPLDSTVTKATGNKPYQLVDTIRFFGEGAPENVCSGKGVLFLVNGSSVNAVPADQELAWTMPEEEILSWLAYREAERESK
jgi:hypothetical protein